MRGPRGAALLLAGAAAGAGTTCARPARAVEREHHLGVDVGASMLLVNDRSSPEVGPGAG
ncbi:MAG: hypothetical protein JOZ69_22390, partial [Myxococcales bacterium]|nr:hypothetical protein [Myxococcales bacterium]